MAQRRSGRSDTAGGVSSRVSRRDLLRGLSAASLLAAAGSGRAVARVLSPARHGFKMGPAVGERVADLVLGRAKVDPFFGLARLTKAPAARISSAESVS